MRDILQNNKYSKNAKVMKNKKKGDKRYIITKSNIGSQLGSWNRKRTLMGEGKKKKKRKRTLMEKLVKSK